MGRKSRAKNAGAARTSKPSPPLPGSNGRGWRIAFLLLCTVGACLSADLLRLHVNVHTNPDYHSYCAMSARVNCDTVAASDYSVLFGLPVALWGLVGYVFLGAMAVWGLRRTNRRPPWPFGLLVGAGLVLSGLAVGLYLLSHFVIESVCIVCGGTYLVNIGLAFTAWMVVRRAGSGPLSAFASDVRSVRTAPKSFVIFALLLLGILVSAWIAIPTYWRFEAATGPGGLAVGRTEGDHPWIGALEPVVEIVEYSDYQCPHCRRGHDEIRRLIEQHADRIRLIHRHYPLDHHCNTAIPRPFHPFACDYALIAHCAQEQGRFWEANDYLFANGRGRIPVGPDELAKDLRIDAEELRSCMRGESAQAAIQRDLEAGRRLGIRGTPTFVIGDSTYPGRVPPDVIRELLGLGESAVDAAPAD